jgi:hypothetical protein
MWKVIVSVLFGCIEYLEAPITSSDELAASSVLVIPSLIHAAVLGLVCFCVLWLGAAGVKALRRRSAVPRDACSRG